LGTDNHEVSHGGASCALKRVFVIAITSRAHFCDRHHITNAMAELASQLSIGTAYAVLTFDVPPKH